MPSRRQHSIEAKRTLFLILWRMNKMSLIDCQEMTRSSVWDSCALKQLVLPPPPLEDMEEAPGELQRPQSLRHRSRSCLLRSSQKRTSGCRQIRCASPSPHRPSPLTQTLSSDLAVLSTCQIEWTPSQVVDLTSPSLSGDAGMISAPLSPLAWSTPSTDSSCTFRWSSTSASSPMRKRKRSDFQPKEPTPTLANDCSGLSEETMSDEASTSGTKSRRRSRAICFRTTEEAEAALRNAALYLRTLTPQAAFSPSVIRNISSVFSEQGSKSTLLISCSQLERKTDLDEEPTCELLIAPLVPGIRKVVYTAYAQMGSGTYSKVYPVTNAPLSRRPLYATECVKKCTNLNDWLTPIMMSHPNVMPAKCIYSGGEFCILMPRMTMTLYEFTTFPLSKDEKSAIMAASVLGVAKAVEYMNSSGIYHNDIKPTNVMLSLPFTEAKLGDFSLSTTLPQPGTVHYTAPEVATPKNNGGTLHDADVYHHIRPFVSDVWSLAALSHSISRRERELSKMLRFNPMSYPMKPGSKRFFKPNWMPSQETINACTFAQADTFCEAVFRRATHHFSERPTAGQLLDSLVRDGILTSAKRQNLPGGGRSTCFVKSSFVVYHKGSHK
ncbi:protein ORF104 [Cyprinid herpesvirus 1]|uniref:Protein ORF104 n=1 Tax=Cyprinid herpesvirus 1 TaxID=317858 RepID=K7PBM1_9VIRU|nr:protein ORF104 [Cyprinid herpesvirus 1]AFJ20401.1 protein ORF104 [Cyprinid herpesvirus 1]